jgi:hypothetical protein
MSDQALLEAVQSCVMPAPIPFDQPMKRRIFEMLDIEFRNRLNGPVEARGLLADLLIHNLFLDPIDTPEAAEFLRLAMTEPGGVIARNADGRMDSGDDRDRIWALPIWREMAERASVLVNGGRTVFQHLVGRA